MISLIQPLHVSYLLVLSQLGEGGKERGLRSGGRQALHNESNLSVSKKSQCHNKVRGCSIRQSAD